MSEQPEEKFELQTEEDLLAEEPALKAVILHDMDMFRQYQNSKVLDENGKIIKFDKQLRNELATKNARLVSFVVKKFYNKPEYKNIREDLIQEGFLGLFTAIDKFDPDRGFKFSTYAVHWVMQACSGFLLEHKPSLHIPSHVRTAQNKLLKFMRDSETALKDVSVEDAKNLGISDKMMTCIGAALRTRNVLSFDEPVAGTENTSVGDTVCSDEMSSEDKMDIRALLAATKKSLMNLSPRERFLILLRYNIIQDIPKEDNKN